MSYRIFVCEDKGPGSVDLSGIEGTFLDKETIDWILPFAERHGIPPHEAVNIVLRLARGLFRVC